MKTRTTMIDEKEQEDQQSWWETFSLLFPITDWRFTVTIILVILVFIAGGYYIGQRMLPVLPIKEKIVHVPEIVPPLGLKTAVIQYPHKTMLEIWLPFGYPLSGYGQDIIFVRREIFYVETDTTEMLQQRVIKKLLEGPTKQEEKKGLYPLVMGSLSSLTFLEKDGKVIVNFSKEFNPGDGTNAIWQSRTAVEETLCQFTGVRTVEILVEGEKIEDSE